MKDKYTIMLPVHRSNIELANRCLTNLLKTSDLNIILIDDFGIDNDYINNPRIKFIHNSFEHRQPLVKIWNQCIKECPTEYVIIASWRQRPTKEHFITIEEKLLSGYGLVAFDGLHFFAFSKHLTTIIGFFDEGFPAGQYEDTDFWNRLRYNNIAIYTGEMSEERFVNNKYVESTWLENNFRNKEYYESKWTEDLINNKLILKKEELNISDRKLYINKFSNRVYKTWDESVLTINLYNYFNIAFKTVEKQ